MAGLSNAAYNRHKDAAFFAALKTGDPGDIRWTDRAGHDWPSKGGSENIAAEINALRLFRPETRERALAAWAWWAERSRTAFEGIEYGSRIYRSRTLAAHLLAYRFAFAPAEQRVRDFLAAWLRLYWTLELLASIDLSHGPQSLRIGARSAGHALHPVQSDYALSLATRETFAWTKPWKFLGPQNRAAEGNLSRILRTLTPEILESSEGIDAIPAAAAEAPRWGTLASTHYYGTEGGVAVWVEHQEGGNTVGIAAMGCDYAEDAQPWCIGPSPAAWAGKERAWRQKGYELTCEEDDGALVARGRVAGAALPVEQHRLPGGALAYHAFHGPQGLQLIA